eukprot:jgi/Chlat1/1301/Chrsp118S01714
MLGRRPILSRPAARDYSSLPGTVWAPQQVCICLELENQCC